MVIIMSYHNWSADTILNHSVTEIINKARSRAITGNEHEYVTWQERISLGKQNVTDLLQKDIG